MGKNLVVRLYRVGFGDCIYVQIPDGDGDFSMLIDCGTSSAAETVLKPVAQHITSHLPRKQGENAHLDLIVATHPHADHIKGFNPAWFEGVSIGRIWISAFMNPAHPQAKKAQALDAAACTAARALLDTPGLSLAPGVEALLTRSLSLSNTEVLSALRQGLPAAHPRVYVARDAANHLGEAEKQEQALSFEKGSTCFRGFQEPGTCLRLLAPEWDIDVNYLGLSPAGASAFTDPQLNRVAAYAASAETAESTTAAEVETAAPVPVLPQPANISARDFRLLRSRMQYSALAFSQEDDDLKNNTSVVLLLEWHGRRLLFTGDAEWDGTGVHAGERNSSWDVMLNIPEVRQMLLKTTDLYKVSHHGSHNGSPFNPQEQIKILQKIASPSRTNIVVSTVVGVHGKKNPVPYPALLAELGRLAKNRRIYPETEAELTNVYQPQRTDRESASTEQGVDYLEITISPKK